MLAVVLAFALMGLVALPVAGDPVEGTEDAGCGGTTGSRERDTTLQAVTMSAARRITGGWQMQTPGLPLTGQSATGADVRVGVVDTGIDPDHPDLSGRVVAWRDFVDGRSEPYDDHGHGTHVAGIIAGNGHLQPRPDTHYFPAGMRGVAPGSDLLIAKAIDADGSGSARRVAQAILWSLDPDGDGDRSDGAHVINLSLGTTLLPSTTSEAEEPEAAAPAGSGRAAIHAAIQKATDQGAVVVVAAGNQQPGESRCVAFPASMPEVITVGATDGSGEVAAFSRSGTAHSNKPDLVAPGVILSAGVTDPGSDRAAYRAEAGTSMAAPMVTGAVALLMQSDPALKHTGETKGGAWRTEHVRAVLSETAKPIAGAGDRDGHGLLRMDAALQLVASESQGGTFVPARVDAISGWLLVGLFWTPARAPPARTPGPSRPVPSHGSDNTVSGLNPGRLNGTNTPEPSTGLRFHRGRIHDSKD